MCHPRGDLALRGLQVSRNWVAAKMGISFLIFLSCDVFLVAPLTEKRIDSVIPILGKVCVRSQRPTGPTEHSHHSTEARGFRQPAEKRDTRQG